MTSGTLLEATSLPDLLRRRARQRGDAGFLRFRDARLTYAEFDARTDALACGLSELGVRQGEVVSVYGQNSPAFLEAWWATLKLGAVFGPVNSHFVGREAAYVVGDSGAVVAFCDAGSAATLSAERDALPALREIVLLDRGDGDGDALALDTLRGRGESPPRPVIDPGDLAALVYTSGTTGRPKGAMLTHGNYLADGAMVAEVNPARASDRFGMIMPLFHVNAQVITTIVPLYLGAEIAMWERFSASTFWTTVAEHQPIMFSAVPTMLAALLYAPGAGEVDTGSVKYVMCGAAPLSRDLFDRFEEKFGVRILEGYGLTEGTCASTQNPYWGPRKVGSIGLPLRGQDVAVLDDEGRRLPPDQPGELCVRGPNVMLGYYNLPEATAEAIRDGWLRTGDVGYADEDGYLYLVDRKKDMIIRGGENIYPREIEEVLAAHPAVREVAVVGRPDEVRGEEVHAVVVLVGGAAVDAEALTAYCRDRLAAYKVPTGFELADELPRTPTGKIDKKPLREALARRA